MKLEGSIQAQYLAIMGKLGGEKGALRYLRGESAVRLTDKDIAAWKMLKSDIHDAVNAAIEMRSA